MLFVYKHVQQIQQMNKGVEELVTMLTTRHVSYLELYRPKLEKNDYLALDRDLFASLLKKRKREDEAPSTTAPSVDVNTCVDRIQDSTTANSVSAVLVRVNDSESSRSSGESVSI